MDNIQTQMLSYAQKRDEKYFAWHKDILLMATTLFGILVTLHSGKNMSKEAHYAYFISLIIIGSGILSGALALYGDVRAMQMLTNQMGDDLKNDMPIKGFYVVKPERLWFYRFSGSCARFLFFCAIPSLIVYAVLVDPI